ncbi:PatB family C-S lyase [Sporolactobacillus shoreicorticis]|uniref:cysteine-S-conjugate beta-lyase n=1 Tax=Sporolactobacillus shoreicorticis TaxID=1923877 RepID=A0ABW5S5G7_9BACL|nr:PatB family C-S lyase [Sporolactobacillus shoreicorticis]MCO7127538.1 PatB family C-S lyase [Sporolactobacillus shoreicorticis]
MSKSIFDQIVQRTNTNCVKWDGAEKLYGKPNLLPMWIADMDFSAPNCILDALKTCLDQKIFGYTLCPESLKQVVQSWLIKHYGWEVPSDAIVFNHNVVSSISLALRVLTKKGDKVLIHNPVYNPFFEQLNQLDRVPVVSKLKIQKNRYFMDINDMERKINEEKVTCILICSPHNPGGRIWEPEELQDVIDLAVKYELPIIADEIHSDLVFSGKKHQPMAQHAAEKCKAVITLMAPTKTFNLAGIGPSYILTFEREIAEKIKQEQKLMVYPEMNPFQIAAMTAAYEKGEQWVNELLDYVKGNIDYVCQHLTQIDGLRCMDNDATYLMWINYAELGFSEQEVSEVLIANGIALQMGSMYGDAGTGFFRMNVATPRANVERGTDMVLRAFKQLTAAHARV